MLPPLIQSRLMRLRHAFRRCCRAAMLRFAAAVAAAEIAEFFAPAAAASHLRYAAFAAMMPCYIADSAIIATREPV